MSPERSHLNAPPIPDHELLRCIAKGSYGSVWLARTILGSYRAVKIVRRSTFKSDRQYEREFEGVRNFEPISRSHPGFVQILHVGRNEVEGHFFYVMEVADDAARGRRIQPATYSPRTLRSELDQRRRLPFEECLLLGQSLLLALEELHARNLVHRDLKPANIIYVEGVPKLADIGTVMTAGHKDTPVGSIGYNPPEGSGGVTGDVFSFGRVLYEMFSGVRVQELHDALPDLRPRLKDKRQHHFCDVIHRACHPDLGRRFPSARTLRDTLGLLLALGDLVSPQAARNAREAGSPPRTPPPKSDAEALANETSYGAVSPDSRLYVRRGGDMRMEAALANRAGLIVISGAAQTGKTSLLGRALQQARAIGARVAFTDLQKFSPACFRSIEVFYQALGESLGDQLELPASLRRLWDPRRSANANFERYLRREVLAGGFGPLVWGWDEVARLQGCDFRGEFCGLLRAWCSERALEPGGPLGRLTSILVVPANARLLAAPGGQPMLDFGEHVELSAFRVEEVEELNRQCGAPLRTKTEVECFHQLVGGGPFLCRYGLVELARRNHSLSPSFLQQKLWPEEVFAEPLRRLSSLLTGNDSLKKAVRRALSSPSNLDQNAFQQLRDAGLVSGDSPAEARIICELYALHFRRHLDARSQCGAPSSM
jgi:hypothetical protein